MQALPGTLLFASMREQMRLVMSWAGPRMIYRKPVFAVIHFIDNLTAPKSKKEIYI